MTERAVEARAFAAMSRRLDAGSDAPLAVAVSGGGDSIALLELAAAWARRVGRQVRVLHLDHRLNPDSGAWAEAVRSQAVRLGCACDVLAWEGSKPATGLPAAARAVRHALLADAARAAGARVILLGHTADDVREGEAMRAGGSSLGRVASWSPSPAWPEGRGLMLLRPLLETARAELRAWLGARELSWIEDPANADLRYARARARAAPLSAAQPHAEPSSVSGFFDSVSEGPVGLLRVRRADYADASDPERRRLLSAALVCGSGRSTPPRTDALARLDAALRGPGKVRATLAGARVEALADEVLIGRDRGRTGLPHAPLEPGRPLVWDGRAELTTAEAAAVAPLAGFAARLPAADRSRLAGIPPIFRPTLPVLLAGDRMELAEPGWLAFRRLQAALGLVAREADLP